MERESLLKKISCIVLVLCIFTSLTLGDETKWISIGSLHSWFSSAGCEIEVGRTSQIPDQQDGLRWPAIYKWQDCEAAKALWIGTTNYFDPLVNTSYSYKVAHCGPRGLDEVSEFMPVEFKLISKFNHPTVVADGILASHTVYMDEVNEVDETLKSDRLLYNVVNTSIGITMTRKIYAFSQRYHDNYFIYDYVFKNTGEYKYDKEKEEWLQRDVTLTDVIFFFQYRYAICRETGPYGLYYLPQSTSWGHNTMNHVLYGDPYRCLYAWQGIHSKCTFDNIGGPYITGDGHLGATQFPGVITLHADRSPSDKSDDPDQPKQTPYLGSDEPITQPNDQFNSVMMADEYKVMSYGHPSKTHSEAVGDEAPDLWGGTPGGYSQCIGFGPYDLAPGYSIHIVLVEGVNGLSREMCYEIGEQWFDAYNNPNVSYDFTLPDNSIVTGSYDDGTADEFKNAWVFTGIDSILKTLGRAKENWENNFYYDPVPPPPDMFTVTSGGDRITLEWSNSAESYEHFAGYKVYRMIHKPDTTFDLIYECGQGTDNPLVNRYEDRAAKRGFDYYYYVTSFDDGTVNTIEPGFPLESSLFWARTIEPAYLRRPPGDKLSEIRVVPNPYNIKAKELQYGESAPDRIMFYNIPPKCLIKIFTERGDLIKTINHNDGSGDEAWNSITSSRQVVVSGIYIAYFEVTEDYYDPFSGDILFRKGDMAVRKIIIIR